MRYDASRSTDKDGAIRSYHWTFGDGSAAWGREVNRIYTQAGRYRVMLSVTDESDSVCNSGQASIEANVNVAPTASIRVPETPLFLGGAHDGVLFDGTESTDPDGDLLTYYWVIFIKIEKSFFYCKVVCQNFINHNSNH